MSQGPVDLTPSAVTFEKAFEGELDTGLRRSPSDFLVARQGKSGPSRLLRDRKKVTDGPLVVVAGRLFQTQLVAWASETGVRYLARPPLEAVAKPKTAKVKVGG